jgi:hypothetical protein
MGQRHASNRSERIQWVAELIAHAGVYGVVAALSRAKGVSRQTLYTWKGRAVRALEIAFGKPVIAGGVAPSLERRILTLLVHGHASERNIQEVLAGEGIAVSLGTIAAVIAQAQARALGWFATVPAPATPRILALDEIYGKDRHGAYLSVVDAQGGAVWQTVGPISVDGESWTLLLWEVRDRGIRWAQTISDGGRAIQDGCETVDPHGEHARDVWHVLAHWGTVQARAERLVTQLVGRREGIARQAARVAAGKPPRGKNRHPDVAVHERRIAVAEQTADALGYLGQEVRRLLEVVVLRRGALLPLGERREEIAAVLALLAEMRQMAPPEVVDDLERVQTRLEAALPGLLVFASRLEAIQPAAIHTLGEDAVGLLAWAWQRRAILGPTTADLLAAIPPAWRETAALLFAAWDNAVRASSLVETWHSILRPHLAVHRGLSPGLLALLAVWHNHRVFTRGVHPGANPLALSGITGAPADWLVALGYPPRSDATPGNLIPLPHRRLQEAA